MSTSHMSPDPDITGHMSPDPDIISHLSPDPDMAFINMITW